MKTTILTLLFIGSAAAQQRLDEADVLRMQDARKQLESAQQYLEEVANQIIDRYRDPRDIGKSIEEIKSTVRYTLSEDGTTLTRDDYFCTKNNNLCVYVDVGDTKDESAAYRSNVHVSCGETWASGDCTDSQGKLSEIDIDVKP